MLVLKEKFLLVLLIMIHFSIHEIKSQEVCTIDANDMTVCSMNSGKEITNSDIEYTPIKIKPDYTYFNTELIDDETFAKFKNLVDETISEFGKFLKTQHKIEKNLKKKLIL